MKTKTSIILFVLLATVFSAGQAIAFPQTEVDSFTYSDFMDDFLLEEMDEDIMLRKYYTEMLEVLHYSTSNLVNVVEEVLQHPLLDDPALIEVINSLLEIRQVLVEEIASIVDLKKEPVGN